ncbi:SusD family outer membrane lipoprotein NanU [Mucilaginibacter sp.]|uniref:SusD family outer membrane lipoprotein NanU n=1 Tax=Mucilaginibacter sp. TaxID=1882438 RepID=UPI003D109457
MKRYIIIILSGLGMFALVSSCRKQLSLTPVSSITDANFFQSASQFDAFMAGIHNNFRANNNAFQILGEMRADIFGTDPGSGSAFTGEATQGQERLWQENLNLDNPGVSNFGGFYLNIDQINLMISKLNTTTVVATATKNYYLGICYGMRAFYYFQIYRTWGNAIIQTDPVTGSSLDITSLAKAASPQTAVMALIKADITQSLASFGSDYSFKNSKSYWSKSATLMLEAEVYLWTSVHNSGGTADATIAENALNDIQTNAGLQLLTSYSSVFSSTNKGNSEIIFAIHYQFNEPNATTNNGMAWIQSTYVPQSGLIANFYDSLANRQFNATTDNWGGLLRAPVTIATFRKFNPLDSRALASIQPAYNKLSNGTYQIAGCFVDKYQGEQDAGVRYITNDFPVYRYADLLLLKATAEVYLGQDPSNEINKVRARAYGVNYKAATIGFPNQAIDANPREAILQERLYEFVFEGKRWYDLRSMGDSYVYEHTALLPANAYALLWPIDRNTLTNNTKLVQTAGYTSF